MTFGWELVVFYMIPSIFGKFEVHGTCLEVMWRFGLKSVLYQFIEKQSVLACQEVLKGIHFGPYWTETSAHHSNSNINSEHAPVGRNYSYLTQNNQWKFRGDQLLTNSPIKLYNSSIVLTKGNIKNDYGLVESSQSLWDIQSLEIYLCHSTWKVIDPVKTQWADHQIQGAGTNGRSAPLVPIFFKKKWSGMKASEVKLCYI